jgi:hypothetical protein
MEKPAIERRRYPRYQVLFPVSVVLAGKGMVRGEAVDVSKRAVFFIIGTQHEIEIGTRVEVVLHLDVPRVVTGSADLMYRGKVVRRATVDGHQGIAVFFDEEIDLSLILAKPHKEFEKAAQGAYFNLSTDCVVLTLSGRIPPERLEDFDKELSQLALAGNTDVVLDMSLLLSLCPQALEAILRAQRLLRSLKRELKVVCPRCRLPGNLRSDELITMVSALNCVYPCVSDALAGEGKLQLKLSEEGLRVPR